MTSIAMQVSTINVPFHGDNLYLVNFNGEPHVPMKPVVEGMGLSWQPQHEKLKTRFSKGITEIVIPTKGGDQSMTCLAFRKFAGWLHTINVGKVRPELREKVARYQEECDDVLYQYWTKGETKNPRKKTTVEERTPLRDAVNLLVGKKGLRYDDAYNMVHQRFNIDSIDELELEQIPLAVEYLHRVALEGELLPSQSDLPLNMNKQFNDSELYDLVCLWSISLILKEDSEEILPALQLLGSDWARKMSGNLGMLTGFIERAGRLLQRESHHIATSTTPPINWRLELARMQKVLG
ncbi:phage antirepressor N-terminal domain-containing protein [Klebsiella aerogenes]|uniref:phage antirepressor N-terminal domain-containing protein n=1 Tax=Klebsiella aerogenes TaxID=548 RepID=UPI00397E59E8